MSYIYPLDLKNKSVRISQPYNAPAHKGIDIAAPRNTPIMASNGGIVVVKMYNAKSGTGFGGYGNVLVIQHTDGLYTLYGHCDKIYVSQGQNVKQGETIAGVGSTGDSTGNHCHFEIKTSKKFGQINPVPYLSGTATPTPTELKWITGNRYLSKEEASNNAMLVWRFFGGRGWTINAVSAMLGNMWCESHINPSCWEDLTPYSGGYGLVQWTPYTNYSKWAGSGWQDNGDKECERILYEFENGYQWIPTSEFPESFEAFSKSDKDIDYLTRMFCRNYERAGIEAMEERINNANYFYAVILGVDPALIPPPDPIYHKKNFKFIYYLRRY